MVAVSFGFCYCHRALHCLSEILAAFSLRIRILSITIILRPCVKWRRQSSRPTASSRLVNMSEIKSVASNQFPTVGLFHIGIPLFANLYMCTTSARGLSSALLCYLVCNFFTSWQALWTLIIQLCRFITVIPMTMFVKPIGSSNFMQLMLVHFCCLPRIEMKVDPQSLTAVLRWQKTVISAP